MPQLAISSQAEYDKAVKEKLYIGNEFVIQNSPDFIVVHTDVTVGKNGRCASKKDGVTITARENGIVAAEGKVSVIGHDNANIIAKGHCKVELYNSAMGNCYENCKITLKDTSKINADGKCTVNAYDESIVSASGNTKVYSFHKVTAKGSDVTTIMAKDNCVVHATDNCKVQAHDNCIIVADKNAKVISQDNCLIMSNGSPDITMHDNCGHIKLDELSGQNILGALKQMAQSKNVAERPLVAIQILKENIPPAKQESVNKRLNLMGLSNQTELVKHINNMIEVGGVPIQKSENQTISFEKQLETARKTGYVQGVCECVAVVGNEQNMGKKLLSEMNVNKDMAKKFANPETYKTLEKGIFADKQEQKLEHTHNVRR